DEIVERIPAGALVRPAWLDVQRLVGRPNAARDEARAAGVAAGELVGGVTGQLGRLLVDLEHMLAERELLQGQTGAVERTRFDNVRAGFEIRAVDSFDHSRLA